VHLEFGQPHLERSPGSKGQYRADARIANRCGKWRGLRRRLKGTREQADTAIVLLQRIRGGARAVRIDAGG
jgi:hypothetical protein